MKEGVGTLVGKAAVDGSIVGATEGSADGCLVGKCEGERVGSEVSSAVDGLLVGTFVGLLDGRALGASVSQRFFFFFCVISQMHVQAHASRGGHVEGGAVGTYVTDEADG
jgi:hypothetical protein